MDKSTLSNYGWVVIAVLVLSVMIALATPFGDYIGNAVKSTTEGLFDVQQKAMGVAGLVVEDQGFENQEDRVTSLAGTTWKFNQHINDYEFLGIFDYQNQSGWLDMSDGCTMNYEGTSYQFSGFSNGKIENYSIFGTVIYGYFDTVGYFPQSFVEAGWYVVDIETSYQYLMGEITTVEEFATGITRTVAPTVAFSDESNATLENTDLINWMYENATRIA